MVEARSKAGFLFFLNFLVVVFFCKKDVIVPVCHLTKSASVNVDQGLFAPGCFRHEFVQNHQK